MAFRRCFLFPGQGSFKCNPLELMEFEPARNVYKIANDVLRFDLMKLPYDNMNQLVASDYLQPAIITYSTAVMKIVEPVLGSVCSSDILLGHSVGEFTALAAAKYYNFSDVVRLTHLRNVAMNSVAKSVNSSMIACYPLSYKDAVEVCEQVKLLNIGVCEISNANSPFQTVLCGHSAAIEGATKLAKQRGVRRIVPLRVTGPCHTSLMLPASREFEKKLKEFNEQKEHAGVMFSNVSGKQVYQIQSELVSHIIKPVLFHQCVENVLKISPQGVHFIEFGSNVLTGLVSQIKTQVPIRSTVLSTRDDIINLKIK